MLCRQPARAQRHLAQVEKKQGQELADLVRLIEAQVAPVAPDLAYDLLRAQLHLAAGIHERTDDSWGTMGDVMRDAVEAIARLAPSLTKDPEALAEEMFEAVLVDCYWAFDHAVHGLGQALGDTGLSRLKALAESVRGAPLTEGDLVLHGFITDPAQREARARAARDCSVEMILQNLADLQGDVDARLARDTPEQLTFDTIALEAAVRLLGAGRAKEALKLVTGAGPTDELWHDKAEIDLPPAKSLTVM